MQIRFTAKRCFGILLTTALTVAYMIPYVQNVTADDETSSYETIKIAPENMLNVQVVDKDGNHIDNILATLKDSSGSTMASWKMGSQELDDTSGIGIIGDTYFDKSIEIFEKLTAPYQVLGIRDINNKKNLNLNLENTVRFNFGEKRDFRLDYLMDYPVVLTVPKDSYAINIDSKWSSRTEPVFLKYDTKNSELKLNENAGTTNIYPLNETYEDIAEYFSYGVVYRYGNKVTEYLPKYSVKYYFGREQSEYIKMRLRLSDAFSGSFRTFKDDGTFEYEYTGGINNGKKINVDFREDSMSDTGKTGVLIISSGNVINVVIPDENGYVDIYVDKSSRLVKYEIWILDDEDMSATYGENKSIRYVLDNKTAYDSKTYTLHAVDFPNEGTTLSYVPSGDYTLELLNVPEQYKQPEVQNITITESQDIQMFKVVLEDVEQSEPDTEKPTPEQPETSKENPETITEKPIPEQPTEQSEPDIEKPALEQPTQNQETPTQQQTTQKQSTPVTGDNISSSLLILIITSIVLFGIVAVIGKKKEVSEN